MRFGIPLRLMLLKEQAVNVTGGKCKKTLGGERGGGAAVISIAINFI